MQNNDWIILFDGVCNLCNGTVDFIIKHDNKKQFRFVPLQSETGQMLIRKYDIQADTDSVVFISQNQVYFESDAILKITGMLPFPWKLAIAGRILPKRIRNLLYRKIAKKRYHWFGKREECRIIDFEK